MELGLYRDCGGQENMANEVHIISRKQWANYDAGFIGDLQETQAVRLSDTDIPYLHM